MDVLLINASVFRLPSTHRAGAIVYDGTVDLGLWRPPGPDRDLWDEYGPDLPRNLEKEKEKLEEGRLRPSQVLRLHPGKLHCDFLVWVGLRPPHGQTEQASAPSAEDVEKAVQNALMFAAEHNVVRIAFPAMGVGRDAEDASERLVRVVRTAHAYAERCFAEGRPPGIEEVLVCDLSSIAVTRARRQVASLAKAVESEKPASSKPAPRRRATTGSGKKRGRSTPPKLDPDHIAHARATAEAYDRTQEYIEGDWFVHPKFGVGRVEEVHPERMITVRFEDGEAKKMVHAR